MDAREILNKVSASGFPIATIAKRIGKDPSTLQKWARGTSPYLSEKTQQDLLNEIKRIKQIWNEIDI